MATLPWEIVAKAILYAAVLAAIGACALRSLLLPRLAGFSSSDMHGLASTLALLRLQLAIAVLVALGLRGLTHTAAVFGWPSLLSRDDLHVVLVESRWGSAWELQVAAATVFLLASAWARATDRGHEWSGVGATGACLVLGYSMPLVGHGASTGWRMALHGTHILGAGIWAGALMAVGLLIRIPRAHRSTLLRGITPLALSGAGILSAAGVVMAWLYLGSFQHLWTTGYGEVLMLKLALVAAAACCGVVNWRRFSGERRGAPYSHRLGSFTLEIVFLTSVVIVTAALTELAHP